MSLWIGFLALVCTGCSVHTGGFEDPLNLPDSFTAEADAGSDGSPVPERWWLAFEDETLNRLQDAALAGNFSLATFRDRVRAARAVVRRERSFFFPMIDASLFAEQTRRESNNFDGVELFSGSLLGTYEVDLFEQIESQVEAVQFQRAVAREELKAAAIDLSAEVAATWYALVEERAQADVLEAQIRTNEQVLQVVRARFGGGVVRASDVLRQERLLESTREQRAVVQSQIEVLEHALLVLLGRSPTETVDESRDGLPAVPPQPALGVPSELVRRRPDIRSALFSIRAADRAVAVAVADRFPSLVLGVDASTSADDFLDLFDDWASTISAELFGPLFDAGRRAAEVDRTEAVKAEQIDLYAQSVLVAFREVVDALAREANRGIQIDRIQKQLELATRTTERLNREYLNGDIPYIDVLDALTTEQQLQRDLLSARFRRITDRIDLYRALAGGWEGIAPPLAEKS